jgi:general secretion pathway protein H
MNQRRLRWGARPGFTLVELLVVLGIIALVIGLAPSIFAGLPGFRLRSAADEMATTMRDLHEEAIRRQVTTELVLDPATRVYRTSSVPDGRRLPPVVTGVAFSTQALRPQDPLARIRFYADGTASGGTIRLNHEGLTASVTVEWLTGRVSRHD